MIARLKLQNSIFFLKLAFITIFIFIFSQSLKASTATPDTFLNLKEIDELTKSVIKINQVSNNKSLEYLFGKNKKEKTLFSISQRKIVDIYVNGKDKLGKHPYKTIMGMAYFEFFYASQIKQNENKIQKFKDTYPNINNSSKKAIKNLYNLNQVRKKMRESIGLSLENKSINTIKNYITLSKYLENSEPKKINLGDGDKKIISYSQKIIQIKI